MTPEIIVTLALVAFAGALLRAGWIVLLRCLDRALDDRIAQHQQYTTLICTRQIERTNVVRDGKHVFIERQYDLPDHDHLIELQQMPRQIPQQLSRIGRSPLM